MKGRRRKKLRRKLRQLPRRIREKIDDGPRVKHFRDGARDVDMAREQGVRQARTDSRDRTPPANNARLDWVRKRVKAHRGSYLSYCTRLELVRRDHETSVVEMLVPDEPITLAAPVLYLHADEINWRRGQLADAIARVLSEFHMAQPDEFKDPTAQASEACRIWAGRRAIELVDIFERSRNLPGDQWGQAAAFRSLEERESSEVDPVF